MKGKHYTFSAIAAGVMLVLFVYLYSANAYIYYRIRNGNLAFPDTKHTYVIGSAVAKEKVYVALGDSLTSGVGVTEYSQSYPYLFAEKLSANTRVTLKNESYPGVKSSDLIANFLPAAIKSHPDIVTLLVGTNDIHSRVSAEQFEMNYRFIVDSLVKKTDAKIYILSVPFIGSRSLYWPPYNYYFDYKTKECNEIIKRIAREYKIPYIDIATPTQTLLKKDGPMYSADSFHPSGETYKMWADILYADRNR